MKTSYSNYASMFEDENEYETYTCEVCEANIHKRLTPFMCYFKELVIMGKGGFLCDKNGEIVEKCNTCNVFDYDKAGDMQGFGVNIEEWDGSDMFFFDNWPGVIIVTEKVKNLIEEKKLKNIIFTNLKEFTFF